MADPVDPEHDYRDPDEVQRSIEAKLDELLAREAPAVKPHEVDVDPWLPR